MILGWELELVGLEFFIIILYILLLWVHSRLQANLHAWT